MMKRYAYVGPRELLSLLDGVSTRRKIERPTDIWNWIEQTQGKWDFDDQRVATFIIDTQNRLWIADRHSEHVVCAQGGPVLSAGEMTFRRDGFQIEVSEVTNQSTGFCPEPQSWPEVESAFHRIGLIGPPSFTAAFDFRRCDQCASTNIIKENWFFCGVCDAELDRTWNFHTS